MFRSRFHRAIFPALVLSLFALAPINAAAQTEQDVDKAADTLERAEATKSAAYQRWLEARERLDTAVARYEEVNAEREALTYTIAQLYDRISEYEGNVIDLREKARALVLEAYINGGTGLMSAAFDAGTIQDLITSQVLIDKATNRDLAELDRLQAVSREMERLREDLGVQEFDIRQLENEAEGLVVDMDQLFTETKTAYNDADQAVRAAIDTYNREKAEFAAAEVRRKAQAAAAARQAASGAAAGLPPEATPGFICPVRGGASFINSWGFPRSGGRKHKGADMFAPRGTDLVAVTSGYVKLRTVNLGGIVTYLYGDDGNQYYYAHNDGYPPGLTDGQTVARGDVIGYLGNSGNARYTSPHLHFEIRPGFGSSVNPYPTVKHYC